MHHEEQHSPHLSEHGHPQSLHSDEDTPTSDDLEQFAKQFKQRRDQAGVYTGGRGARAGHPLRQRLLPDHHLQVRGAPAELQEHVQTQAPAE